MAEAGWVSGTGTSGGSKRKPMTVTWGERLGFRTATETTHDPKMRSANLGRVGTLLGTLHPSFWEEIRNLTSV